MSYKPTRSIEDRVRTGDETSILFIMNSGKKITKGFYIFIEWRVIRCGSTLASRREPLRIREKKLTTFVRK